MSNANVRWGWLRFMYGYTIAGAGGFGLGMLFTPDIMKSLFAMPDRDPVIFGIAGSVYASFGILSILGLRSPLKYVPVLVLQLSYKSIWFLTVFLPLLLAGKIQFYGILFAVTFATYIVGDLIAIPFSYVFGRQSDQIDPIRTLGPVLK
ncbi:hypothetical protein HZA56_00955 [Candidatus Poribacteria bacterium]|nr:hypothetical protein [Candidatus Poribacteria bacterium]